MTLSLELVLRSAGIDPADAQVIRHVFVREHEGTGQKGIQPGSSDDEILTYTSQQSVEPHIFPTTPPPFWVVFLREGGDRARLWSVVENRGEVSSDDSFRTFDIERTHHLSDLSNRLVIHWRSPRTWRLSGSTAGKYPVVEISDSHPLPFPGFDRLVLDYNQLQAVMREPRYEAWRTALASVLGIYLITDTLDGRQYVGKADGGESIRQRWGVYAANGHGGNVALRTLDSTTFRFSLLRVFDPSTPSTVINAAEGHYKSALDTRTHGLNRN